MSASAMGSDSTVSPRIIHTRRGICGRKRQPRLCRDRAPCWRRWRRHRCSAVRSAAPHGRRPGSRAPTSLPADPETKPTRPFLASCRADVGAIRRRFVSLRSVIVPSPERGRTPATLGGCAGGLGSPPHSPGATWPDRAARAESRGGGGSGRYHLGMANRLADETSPYCSSTHTSRRLVSVGSGGPRPSPRENKPIFLSIGYAACHWCMSWSRELRGRGTAEDLNRDFVA